MTLDHDDLRAIEEIVLRLTGQRHLVEPRVSPQPVMNTARQALENAWARPGSRKSKLAMKAQKTA